MPEETPRIAAADIVHAGTWRIDPGASAEATIFALHYPPTASNASRPIGLHDLGLSAEALAGAEHPIRFEVRRESGTFACDGIAGDGHGSGSFSFFPDAAYAGEMAAAGIALTLRDQIQAGLFDLRLTFVNAIVATGVPDSTLPGFLKAKIFKITPERIRELFFHFPKDGFEELILLAMAGVDGAYLQALQRLGVRDLSAENVSALRACGVEVAFLERLIVTGTRGLSIDEIVRLRRP